MKKAPGRPLVYTHQDDAMSKYTFRATARHALMARSFNEDRNFGAGVREAIEEKYARDRLARGDDCSGPEEI